MLAAREGLGGRIGFWLGFCFPTLPTLAGEDSSSEEASWRMPAAEWCFRVTVENF